MPRVAARLKKWAPGVAFIASLAALMELVARLGLVDAFVAPPPSQVGVVWVELIADGEVITPLLQTMGRLGIGLLLGALLAIALGIAVGMSQWIEDLVEPTIEVLRPIPRPALLPPLMLFMGLGSRTIIAIIVLAAFFPILINTIQGVKGVEETLLATARTFGTSRRRTVLKVVLPAAAPFIATGLRISVALGLTLAVLAEMLTGGTGIGFEVIDMQRSFRTREMYAWIAIVAIVGLTLNSIFVAIERRVLHWSYVK